MNILKKIALSPAIRFDIVSGFLVFLVALPLSLGIAEASGFPPIAGIYSAIVGGLVATFFSNARFAIKGPAAGLIVIALGASESLGYKGALACVVISGVLQVVFAFLKVGKFSDFFPSSVIHGLLAAIGIIIISKQVAGIFGVIPFYRNPIALLLEVPSMMMRLNPKIAFIGIGSLVTLAVWKFVTKFLSKTFAKFFTLMPRKFTPKRLSKAFTKLFTLVPAQIIVLLFAVSLGLYFDLHISHEYTFKGSSYQIKPEQMLVVLPEDITTGFTLPDWSKLMTLDMLKYVIMFALIGSLESVLSAKAIDSIDPQRRKTDYDKDLLGVGVSNTLLGFIGGLPIITAIVRSSANISGGAVTRWASFFHGLFMFLFVVLASSFINHIPIAALAAMLVFTGFNLASPKEFKKNFQIGKDQFLVFCTTILVTLATDLLIGVGVGIIANLIIQKILSKKTSLKYFFKTQTKIARQDEKSYHIEVSEAAVFSNYLGFKYKVEAIPLSANWILDFSQTQLIDHTFMTRLSEKQEEIEKSGGTLHFSHLEELISLSDHPTATRVRR